MQYHTYSEIMQQPTMWSKEFKRLLEHKEEIKQFFKIHIERGYRIVFSGAGTSAFIGDILEIALRNTPLRDAKAIATTDLITHASSYFDKDEKVLLISFARSGNSPESVGTVEIVDQICRNNVSHVFITCNSDGYLAKLAEGKRNTLLLMLPKETNDKSLAMTSSFTTMLFTGISLGYINELDVYANYISELVNRCEQDLKQFDPIIKDISKLSFSRVIFLGSGALKGVAEESHLKVQEMSDGNVISCFDSFLGFRHGPKAVINKNSIMIYLLSDDPYVQQYEMDLIKQIRSNNHVVATIIVSIHPTEPMIADYNFVLGEEINNSNYFCIPYIFIAQLLGYYKSIDLGLNPDTPSLSGNISRVVEGVKIYKTNLNLSRKN